MTGKGCAGLVSCREDLGLYLGGLFWEGSDNITLAAGLKINYRGPGAEERSPGLLWWSSS